jgi:hypothetical protein
MLVMKQLGLCGSPVTYSSMFVRPVQQAVKVDSDVLSLDESDSYSVENIPYANQFLKFIDETPTRYHGVDVVRRDLIAAGYEELKENEVIPIHSTSTKKDAYLLRYCFRTGLLV